jgi:hypothetical protein
VYLSEGKALCGLDLAFTDNTFMSVCDALNPILTVVSLARQQPNDFVEPAHIRRIFQATDEMDRLAYFVFVICQGAIPLPLWYRMITLHGSVPLLIDYLSGQRRNEIRD